MLNLNWFLYLSLKLNDNLRRLPLVAAKIERLVSHYGDHLGDQF